MDYFGVYHQDYVQRNGSVCDAPCVSKGRMMLCAYGSVTEGGLIGMLAGRLRNRRALAAELDCPPDTEAARLLLRAYRRWGADYPGHIEGPAATCVMDAQGDAMVLSRDRMGEQPVFYTRAGARMAFSDHPDTLLKNACAEPVMDADGMRELFGLGPARTPGRTYFRDIAMLEPGCALAMAGEDMRVHRYYSIEARQHEDDEVQTISRVRALLEQAVDDVMPLNPVAMLSGGLDSTALTALMARRREGLMTFSVDYQDNDRDFRANAFRPERDAP